MGPAFIVHSPSLFHLSHLILVLIRFEGCPFKWQPSEESKSSSVPLLPPGSAILSTVLGMGARQAEVQSGTCYLSHMSLPPLSWALHMMKITRGHKYPWQLHRRPACNSLPPPSSLRKKDHCFVLCGFFFFSGPLFLWWSRKWGGQLAFRVHVERWIGTASLFFISIYFFGHATWHVGS